jgi:AcrR family transcriptional regulator
MVEACASHGYADTSVAELCRLAGISKRTFYEQFQNKEACFSMTYDRILSRVAARVTAESMRKRGWRSQLASGTGALMDELSAHPKAAQLVLLEAEFVSPTVRTRHGSLRAQCERIVAAGFGRERADRDFPPLVARGIVAGFERVISDALLEADGLGEPAQLSEALARWASSYGGDSLGKVGAAKAVAVKGTTHASARSVRRTGRRARILRATAELLIIEGHGCPSMARISQRAGLDADIASRYYNSPEDCLREAMELLSLEVLICVSHASRSAGNGVPGACLGIIALMRRLAADQVMRGALFPSSDEPDAVRRGERVLNGVLDVLLKRIPEASERSPVASSATVGALRSVIVRQAVGDEGHTLTGSGTPIAYLALAPFVDAQALTSALEALAAAAPRGAPAGA